MSIRSGETTATEEILRDSLFHRATVKADLRTRTLCELVESAEKYAPVRRAMKTAHLLAARNALGTELHAGNSPPQVRPSLGEDECRSVCAMRCLAFIGCVALGAGPACHKVLSRAPCVRDGDCAPGKVCRMGSCDRAGNLAPQAHPLGATAREAVDDSPKRIFAKKFVVNVRSAPNREAPRIGYLRAGAVLAAKTAQPVGRVGCLGGWYELTTSGFACAVRDVIAFDGDRPPERSAAQPDLDADLPYQYAISRRNTPMYSRLPTGEELAAYEGSRIPGAMASPGSAGRAADGGVAVAAPVWLGATTEPAVQEQQVPEQEQPLVADAGPPTLATLMGERGGVLMRRLVKGFYVSLDREMQAGSRRYWRTLSNGFVPHDAMAVVRGSEFSGVVIDDAQWALPIGFVAAGRARTLAQTEAGQRRGPDAAYHHVFRIAGESVVDGRRYEVTSDGRLIRASDVVRLDARPRPSEVGPAEKWIDVDLARQSLVAYEGDRPVYSTLVSSGRGENARDPLMNFATPTGSFRITSKHIATNMDGDHAVDGPYSIEDVPYVMYFQLAYALHSAFWHNRFGHTRSHGCINLSPRDARWLFNWSEPIVPTGWHGAYPTTDRPGTRLYVRGNGP